MTSTQAETKCSPVCAVCGGTDWSTECPGPSAETEMREALVRDRDLCRCGDQRTAHWRASVTQSTMCLVEGCPCKKFHASGDNLEDSLKAWPAEATERLLADVLAVPPDKSPQQRWLGDAQGMMKSLLVLISYASEVGTATLLAKKLSDHLEAMSAPFDWDAVGLDMACVAFPDATETLVQAQAGAFSAALKGRWIGGCNG